ncbi:hypothetical protein [Stenotrophomonas sp. SMYL86]|uniref:hypothetical protein n=1 Tax=Stenotrophomonas sp. SMYL86 TaxID=3076044 RepID=UPI002E75E7E0|nr:hypothetical protein [Stenotrophomonas sp. SMYL86]
MNTNNREALETILGGRIEQRVDRIAPGINRVAGVEVIYYEDDETSGATSQFDLLLDSAGEIVASHGGIVSDSCRIVAPNGQCYQCLTFHGDLDGWRKAVEAAAKARGIGLARIEGHRLKISEDQSFALEECRIEVG